ncbi:hypothetical protein H072_5970 [Dactylellina haptotyla CBS 200.50]|uniref:Mitochondrial ATPase inhibitor n=1 Tax=Dactylellina haptotyla (strain CBS 200.50) TaxID=1284197 RepID=S8AGA4_DACHA|nr:hypothetical protein H072_5970 [Dactylellina haptotyla CBS 200.50]
MSTSIISRRIFLAPSRGALAFTTARAQYSSYSSRHENDPEKLNDHKNNSLKDQKAGKGQWNENLASDAEAFIKAEREEIKTSGDEIGKLQKKTNELLEKAGLKG